jgi:hypothetical protein
MPDSVGCVGSTWEEAVVSLREAVSSEREKQQQDSADNEVRREVGREVLGALFERLTKEPLLGWSFVMKNDEIVVSQVTGGAESRESIGSWVVDPNLCLKFADETTEWITPESVGRVLDEAVRITARRMVDVEQANSNVLRLSEKTG